MVLSVSHPARFLLSIFLGLTVMVEVTNAEERPNFILCMGDDHGWEETGYNGHQIIQTPNLDQMANEGLRLDRFYAGHPSCSPTRGSVLTGRHPNRYGTFSPGWSLRPEEISIAQLLHDAGYQCGHFGKWHLGPVKKSSPTNPGAMGFNRWLSHDNFFELNPVFSSDGGPPEVYVGESSEILVKEALNFIRSAKSQQQPFFVVLWFGSPHEPYSGLKKDLAIYDELPARFPDQTVRLTSNETGKPVKRPLGEVLQERYAEITAMDRAIGQLRTGLEDEAVRQNTLLWYCGDNGTPPSGLLSSPLKGQKSQMYEGGIRVPGVIEWPSQIKQPAASEHNAVTSDILPTLCSAAGISPTSRPIDGIDLLPMFRGEVTRRASPLHFWSFNTRLISEDAKPWIAPDLQEGTTPLVKLMKGKPTRTFRNVHHTNIRETDFGGARAITTQSYKLILDQSKSEEIELYHLEDDPGESRNLANSKPALVQELSRQMRSWQESVLQSLTGKDYQ